MKILKVVVINILVFIVLLFILDFIFAVIDTKQYFRIIIQNSHTESTRPQKVSALRIFAKTIDRISYYYFRKDYKIFCSKNDFREPSCGKFYKNKNMIIAGCSYTYGDCLDYKDTLGVVLTEYLKDYKVYNIGLSGASPRETLYILRNCDEFTNKVSCLKTEKILNIFYIPL